MHIDITTLFLQLQAVGIGIIEAIAVQHDLRTERARAFDLEDRRRRGHADHGFDAEFLRRIGHALRVVASRGRDDALRPLLRRQLGNLIVGPAQLECAGMLQILRLQPHLVARKCREILAREQRRMTCNAPEPLCRLLHILQAGRICHFRIIHKNNTLSSADKS